MLGLPFGLLQIWRRYRNNVLALALAVGAFGYPASQVIRLTQRGFFVSVRALEFLFVAVAFILAVGVVDSWLVNRPSRRLTMIFTALATIIFVGGVILGRPPWMRLPGPYLVVADTRSIELQGLAAAEWAGAFLGPDNRIATDRINGALMGAYGEQRVVTGIADAVPIATVFFSLEVSEEELSILKRGRVRYLVVDRRLNSGLPMAGFYFQMSEPGAYRHTTPMDPKALTKFDGISDVSRLFDSGDIVIYDVGVLAGVR